MSTTRTTLGWFADKSHSRRIPLLLGLLALAASTAMLCASTSLAVLVTGRFLQGISAAVVWTVGLALLSDTVDKEDIGQVMGYIAAATSVGTLAGPLLGGVVYARAGYYAVFIMGFALIGLDIVLRLAMIENSVAEQWSLSNEVLAAQNQGVMSTSPENVIASKRRSDEIQPVPNTIPRNSTRSSQRSDSEKVVITKDGRQLPAMIRLLRIPRLLASLFGCFVQSSSLAAFDSVLPLYVKNTFSWTSTGAGLIFICLVVPALCAPIIGILSDKYGPRPLATLGLIGAVPFWVCLRFVTDNTISQKVLLCALLALIGFALTLVMAPLMAEIDHVLEEEEKRRPGGFGKKGAAAQGFGLFNTAFAVGTLVGPLWAGFVVEKAGWGTMGWTLGVLSGVAAAATFLWTGGRILLKEEGDGGVV